jgi:pyruvate/2-oxoglutarate/acetoin dehydrogenase E1 component
MTGAAFDTVAEPGHRTLTYRDALRETMRDALARHPHVIILGQGVDDHKAIFGTTLGLADEFGRERVMDTPIAEEGMTGVAIGAALGGLYPIHTHIRVDFAMLAMNQIVNLMAKYRYMFGGRLTVPMLIRLVIGRGWGQGAQHSQSLQSMLAHVPGLRVVMPAHADVIVAGYPWLVARHDGPVISIEHRLLYDVEFRVGAETAPASPFFSRVARPGKHVTVVATSIMVLDALRAAEHLASTAGIQVEVVDLNCVSHPDAALVTESVVKTGKLLVLDTSWQAYGVCAEVCRLVCERRPDALSAPAVTMGMAPAPCPTGKTLEDRFYPNLRRLVAALARLATGHDDHGIPLPDDASQTDVYRRFRGPF